MASRRDPDPGKREQILLAAEQVFAERGFKGATTREVAEKAGNASSLIFYYFKNKTALYEAVFQNFFDQLEDLIQQHLSLDLDRLGQLREFLFSVTDYSREHRNMIRILLREIIDDGRMVREIAQKYFAPLYETWNEVFQEGKKEALFREVDPLHHIHSLIGTSVFYFIAEPIIRELGGHVDPYGSEEIEKRKIEVWNLVRSSLM
jgi:AcrR family transcriptional regulator